MNRTIIALAASLVAILAAPAAHATIVSFDVDETQSTLTVTGDIAGVIPLTPQFVGSNILTLDGSILANIGLGNITFVGGSAIDAIELGTPVQPLPGGGAGSAPGDAGVFIGNPPSPLGTVAIRGFVADVTSGVLTLSGGTYNGTFNGTLVTLGTTAGNADYNVTGFGADSASIAGLAALNEASPGTLAISDLDLTLTIPVSLALVLEVQEGVNATINLNGQLVATGVLPEPATMGMAVLGMVALSPFAWRRIRMRRQR